jgi:hypothetical protein
MDGLRLAKVSRMQEDVQEVVWLFANMPIFRYLLANLQTCSAALELDVVSGMLRKNSCTTENDWSDLG